jgi:carboxyl-terminal processing protease
MRSGKKSRWVFVFVFFALIIGFFGGFFVSNRSVVQKILLNTGNKIEVILDIINDDYVDEVDVNKLVEDAIPKIVGELDPHSNYMSAKDMVELNENMEGHFAGMGVDFIIHDDTLAILHLLNGGPAEQAGLIAGDRIVSVDDVVLTGNSLSEEQILNVVKGDIGSAAKMGIKRANLQEIQYYQVVRSNIPITSVKAAYEVEEGIGLIKLYKNFSHTTYDEFISAMAKLLNKGCKSFILDLRMNGGGSFEAAVNICNELLHKGSNIVYMSGKSFPREDVTANGLGTLQDNQIVVLTDQISASASEIVAGAIQDNDRGLIIGRHSFGKGLVQNQIDLSDGSALLLTVARYYTPSGRNIQRKYVMGKTDEYNRAWIDRLTKGEGFHEDSIVADQSELYYTLSGRTVYGGGGIVPDIFVPIDTAELTTYYMNLEDKNIFQKFAFKFSDENRSRLNEFHDYQDMLQYLKVQPLIYDIVRYAEENGIKRRSKLISISTNHILTTTYAHILQNFFGEEAYFIEYMSNDKDIKKAVEIIQKGYALPESIAKMEYKVE